MTVRRRRVLLDFSLAAPGGATSYAYGFLGAFGEHADAILAAHDGFDDEAVVLSGAGVSVVRSRGAKPGTWRGALGRQLAVGWWSMRLRPTHAFVPREIAPVVIWGELTVLVRNLLLWRTGDGFDTRKMALRRLAARIGVRRASAVIAPSAFMARYVDHDRSVVVPYGCDLPPGHLGEKERSDVGARFLCLGSVWSYKRFDIAIETVELLKRRGIDATLTICGGWPDAELARALAADGMRRLGYDPLTGPVSPQDRVRLFRGFDVLFVGSSVEAFGNSIVEAMRTSTVVVAPESPLAEELCGPCAVTYKEGSADSAADAIASALPEFSRYAEGGLERSMTFTWERCVAQTIDAALDQSA
jgi:glycosyltransferase involved in cell wall biosynthesis